MTGKTKPERLDEEESDGEVVPEPIRRGAPRIVIDPATMAEILVTTDPKTGVVTKSAVTEAGPVTLGEVHELVQASIPWQAVIETSKPMNRSQRRLVAGIVELCILDDTASIKRTDLIKKLHRHCKGPGTIGNVRDILAVILKDKFSQQRHLTGLDFKDK